MYADNTVLLFHHSSWEQLRVIKETGLALVTSWLENNLLSLNTLKTKYLCFRKTNASKPPINYKIVAHTFPCNRSATSNALCNCNILEIEESIKYLGIVIDSKLTWGSHIEMVSNRIRKLIYVFKQLRLVANHNLLIQTYKALAECVIGYCISSWGAAAKSYMIKLERAQRVLIKVAMSLPFRYPTIDLYNRCSLLSVRKLYIFECLKIYHKKTIPDLPVRKTRINKCPTPHIKSTYARRHYNFTAPSLYNHLNKKIGNTKQLTAYKFKQVIKNWLGNLDYEETEKLFAKLN